MAGTKCCQLAQSLAAFAHHFTRCIIAPFLSGSMFLICGVSASRDTCIMAAARLPHLFLYSEPVCVSPPLSHYLLFIIDTPSKYTAMLSPSIYFLLPLPTYPPQAPYSFYHQVPWPLPSLPLLRYCHAQPILSSAVAMPLPPSLASSSTFHTSECSSSVCHPISPSFANMLSKMALPASDQHNRMSTSSISLGLPSMLMLSGPIFQDGKHCPPRNVLARHQVPGGTMTGIISHIAPHSSVPGHHIRHNIQR